jgi:Putative restriction endonuclease
MADDSHRSSDYTMNLSLIFEVLSPSTLDVDRREKLQAYRQLRSLAEYVLVYQDQIKLELYQKGERDKWQCHVFDGVNIVPLKTLKTTIIALERQSIIPRSRPSLRQRCSLKLKTRSAKPSLSAYLSLEKQREVLDHRKN